MSSDLDQDLQSYFTDVEHLRDIFKSLVAAQTLTKRLLVIHGIGGVGKSSLLRMFRLHCKSVKVPVALASGDEAKSALAVLYFKSLSGEERGWVPDLKVDGVHFPKFDATFEHYRAIQAQVDAQAKKAGGRAADIAGKAASKTTEAAVGALAGAAIGSVIPGIGTAIGSALGGVLGGMGAEALVNWLRGFLKQPDIDLLLDPAKTLTDDFLADVANAANKRRIVLMLDTFEQMTALDDWARDVAQRLHANALFVIAGRALPNWSRAWQSWMATAQVEELKPMTEDDMRELVRRYYATMRGGEPNAAQVEAIIRFARGLPIAVTSVVRLWVKYPDRVGDLKAVKPEVMADLVDLLMEGVPKELIPTLEAAAIVRWFDQPILRAVMKQDDVRDVYNELRRFPFARVRVEGLALHDAVREIVDENLRVQDSERHRELHERAAVYFEKRLEKAETSEVFGAFGSLTERLGLERLYHRIRADEETGIKLFQEMAEELLQYRLVNRLRALLNDANTYVLERENSRLWREYYNARLAHLETRLTEAEKVYQVIGNEEHVEPKLRAYALCDWGDILCRPIRVLSHPLGTSMALSEITDIIHRSLQIAPLDSKLVSNFTSLRTVYELQHSWLDARSAINRMLQFCIQRNDLWGVANAYFLLRWNYNLVGDFRQMLAMHKAGCDVASSLISFPFVRLETLRTTRGWIWMGRYAEVERNFRETHSILSEIYTPEIASETDVNLAHALGHQGKFNEAHQRFERAFAIREEMGDEFFLAYWETFWGEILLWEGNLNDAESHLGRSLTWKKNLKADYDTVALDLFGKLFELRHVWVKSEENYHQSLNSDLGCYYLKSSALTGLARVKHAQGDYAAIPPLLAEAEQLAQQYEYNDHLASLRLTQGMTTDKIGLNGQTTALDYFKQALIYALRYNRFLLDEVLSGRPQGTPLRPIIPYCLARGQEGRQMLIALRDWWQTGVNDIGAPRPDTISPIPEGIPLLEAERIARVREPGDGSPQRSVVEQIEAALRT